MTVRETILAVTCIEKEKNEQAFKIAWYSEALHRQKKLKDYEDYKPVKELSKKELERLKKIIAEKKGKDG